jgi:hypothetical protein
MHEAMFIVILDKDVLKLHAAHVVPLDVRITRKLDMESNTSSGVSVLPPNRLPKPNCMLVANLEGTAALRLREEGRPRVHEGPAVTGRAARGGAVHTENCSHFYIAQEMHKVTRKAEKPC